MVSIVQCLTAAFSSLRSVVLEGSHGKQDTSRSLRSYDDEGALPDVPQGRIGRPCLSSGGRCRRGGESANDERLDSTGRSSIERAASLARSRPARYDAQNFSGRACCTCGSARTAASTAGGNSPSISISAMALPPGASRLSICWWLFPAKACPELDPGWEPVRRRTAPTQQVRRPWAVRIP